MLITICEERSREFSKEDRNKSDRSSPGSGAKILWRRKSRKERVLAPGPCQDWTDAPYTWSNSGTTRGAPAQRLTRLENQSPPKLPSTNTPVSPVASRAPNLVHTFL
ncbi:Hypothetical protein NTJ_03558 [Nesidiocoris tenuis]|uniref:Uncharacterized protein n=1 Tax=Nesidiocoris tenuis TaxID=355587 RepID=A0ABN7AIQ1_9HEMI|nr:Hypothetical protein NTJ_03558 [Nesidiocoris tenuis]